MFLAHFRLELRIVQQQISQLRSLLHQIDLGHALGLALEFLGRNTDQLSEYIPGIVEGERLVKVACKNVSSQSRVCHMRIRFGAPTYAPLKELMTIICPLFHEFTNDSRDHHQGRGDE